ncbi:MAG: alpha/beta hydrolase-fold protein [Acidobacteriota bacterium]
MKLHLTAALAATCAVSVAATALVADYRRGRLMPSEFVELPSLESALLGERRNLIVRLPDSYHREPARRYPVVYVLDGSSLDVPAAQSAAVMARIGVMPEVIVVGIPNVSGEGRQRDYTPPYMAQDAEVADSPRGAADRFLAFLEQELIPFVEGRYRTTGLRALAGHSRGGLFVCYSLIEKPHLFQARVAHSPALWRDGEAIVGRLASFLKQAPALDGVLYLSLGSEENAKMTAAFRSAEAVLRVHAEAAGLRWQADVVSGANHQTNATLAMPLGLEAAFAAATAVRSGTPGS